MPHVTKIDGEDPREDTKINLTADICVNPQGVINRLNPAQNIEMELNFIGQHIRYRMESMDNTEDKWNLMISFIEAVDDDTAKAYHQVWDALSDEDKDSLVEDAIVHGIYLQQKPFWDNVDVFKLGDIYGQFDVDRYTVDKVKKPMIFGEEYYVLLHHRTKDKFSVRSSSALSYQNLPTKSSDLKLGRSRINDNAIRLGEMETMNSNFMEGNLDGIMEILNKYGNSDSARKHMIFNQLTGDPYNPDIDFDLDEEDTGNNVKILDNYLEGIGYELHVSEENPDTELKDKINNLSTERLTEIMKDLSKEAYQSEDAKNDLVDELDPQYILDNLK